MVLETFVIGMHKLTLPMVADLQSLSGWSWPLSVVVSGDWCNYDEIPASFRIGAARPNGMSSSPNPFCTCSIHHKGPRTTSSSMHPTSHDSSIHTPIHPLIYDLIRMGGHSIWRHAMWGQPCSHLQWGPEQLNHQSIITSIHDHIHLGPISFGGMQCGHSHAAIHFSSCMPLLVLEPPRVVRHGYPSMHILDLDHDRGPGLGPLRDLDWDHGQWFALPGMGPNPFRAWEAQNLSTVHPR